MANEPLESHVVLEEPESEKEEVALLGFNPNRVSLAGAKAAIAAWEAGEFTIKWLEAMALHFTRKRGNRSVKFVPLCCSVKPLSPV